MLIYQIWSRPNKTDRAVTGEDSWMLEAQFPRSGAAAYPARVDEIARNGRDAVAVMVAGQSAEDYARVYGLNGNVKHTPENPKETAWYVSPTARPGNAVYMKDGAAGEDALEQARRLGGVGVLASETALKVCR